MMDVVLIKTVYRMEWMDHCAAAAAAGARLKIEMESVCTYFWSRDNALHARLFLAESWLLHCVLFHIAIQGDLRMIWTDRQTGQREERCSTDRYHGCQGKEEALGSWKIQNTSYHDHDHQHLKVMKWTWWGPWPSDSGTTDRPTNHSPSSKCKQSKANTRDRYYVRAFSVLFWRGRDRSGVRLFLWRTWLN